MTMKKVTEGPIIMLYTVIPALGRLRQEDLEFKVSLDSTVRPCLKKKKERKGKSQDDTWHF
jgi:hypothetical protein